LKHSWIIPAIEYYNIFFGEKANIVFDVGSRDGRDAALISNKLNSDLIYAIEARPKAAKYIQKKYPLFKVITTAISDYEGTTEFYEIISKDDDYAGSSSIYNNKFERPEYPHKVIEVPVTTMASVIEENNLSNMMIDFVKVDIEGYTYQLLVGMGDYVTKVKMFHLETETEATHDNHKNNWEVADFMRRNGFVMVAKQYEWGEDIEDQIWINMSLATNEEEVLKWQKF
jgi:FkbM family methyltransferase